MVAYNFKPQFAAKIEAGEKLQTIRKSRRCSPGATLQLYTGQRTKKCRLLATVVCTQVLQITIDNDGVSAFPPNHQGKHMRPGPHLEKFAQADGFRDWPAMRDFFHYNYALPFNGYLIKWSRK